MLKPPFRAGVAIVLAAALIAGAAVEVECWAYVGGK
jgi:hypothetical protein